MKNVFILTVLVSLSACHVQSPSSPDNKTVNKAEYAHEIITDILPEDLTQPNKLQVLYNRYNEWKNTPYKLGGFDKNGIDCSGFVSRTFADEFNIALPRSTLSQSQLDNQISRNNLSAGDLVFFKIPNQKRYYHVGIYLENNRFLHASTSKGVIISNLSNPYWHNNYFKAIQILP